MEGGATYTLDKPGLKTNAYNLNSKDPVIASGDYNWYVVAEDAASNTTHENPFYFKIAPLLPVIPAVPLLDKPAANSHINDATFSWMLTGDAATISGLTSEIQVDDRPGFSRSPSFMLYDGIIDHGGLSSNLTASALDDPLLSDPTGPFYWRVRAYDAATGISSLWSVVRTFRFSVDKPGQPKLLSPGEGAYLSQRRPTFSWSAVPGAVSYDLQITNNSTTLPVITPITKTSYTLPASGQLDYGTVSWSVTARDAYGNLSDVSDPGTFQIFVQSLPLPGSITTNTRPVFSWSAYPGAGSYELIITNINDPANPSDVVSQPVGSTKTSYRLSSDQRLKAGKYIWQVKVNGIDSPTNWQLFIQPTLPAAPKLISPADKALIGKEAISSVSWTNVAFADNFEIEISSSAQFSYAVPTSVPGNDVDLIITDPNPLPSTSGTYYWRVRRVNSDGASGSWGAVRSIKLDLDEPASPFLLSPANGGSVTNPQLTLTWSSIADAAGYDVVFAPGTLPPSTDPAFPQHTRLGKVTSYKLPATIGEGEYSWTVRAYDAAGNVSDWSFPNYLTILAGLSVHKTPTPTPTAPPVSPTLTVAPVEPSLTPTPTPTQPTVEPPAAAERTATPASPTDEPPTQKPTATPLPADTASPFPELSATPAP